MCVQDSDLSTLSSFRKIEREMSLFFLTTQKPRKRWPQKISAIAKEKSDFPFSKLHRKDFFLQKKSFDVGGKSAYIFLTFLMYLTV